MRNGQQKRPHHIATMRNSLTVTYLKNKLKAYKYVRFLLYHKENKERKQKQSERAGTKRYINKSDIKELKEVQQWLDNRISELRD